VGEVTLELAHARSAGLRYVDARMLPGIERRRTRSGFEYFDATGKRIEDEGELARIRALAIPPAYESVWICPIPHGHVQATARDAKGRKQYRYHKRWREVRDANKYESTVAFAHALPALRARVARDLLLPDMSRDKVLATVVRIMEKTLIRVGNETYARENESYGLTTLRPRHVRIEANKRIRLRFRGKSGVEHAVTIEDRRLARTVKRCRDLPGETLFSYVDDARSARAVQSDDVTSICAKRPAPIFPRKTSAPGMQPSFARLRSTPRALPKPSRKQSRRSSPPSRRPRKNSETAHRSAANRTCIPAFSKAIWTNASSNFPVSRRSSKRTD